MYLWKNTFILFSNASRISLTVVGVAFTYTILYSVYRYWGEKNWTIVKNIKPIIGNPLDGDIYAHMMNINSEYIVRFPNFKF